MWLDLGALLRLGPEKLGRKEKYEEWRSIRKANFELAQKGGID